MATANNAKLNSAGYINNVMSYDVQIPRRHVFFATRGFAIALIRSCSHSSALVLMEMLQQTDF